LQYQHSIIRGKGKRAGGTVFFPHNTNTPSCMLRAREREELSCSHTIPTLHHACWVQGSGSKCLLLTQYQHLIICNKGKEVEATVFFLHNTNTSSCMIMARGMKQLSSSYTIPTLHHPLQGQKGERIVFFSHNISTPSCVLGQGGGSHCLLHTQYKYSIICEKEKGMKQLSFSLKISTLCHL
jgi:hypothetical protein